MENITLNLAETKVLIDALPATTRNSRAVRGWLEAVETWTTKASTAAKLDVVVTLESNAYSRTFRLEIFSGCRYYIHSAQVFLRLEIPNPGQRIKRRVSLRRFDYINGKKHGNAIPQIQRNIETNLKYA